MNLKIEKTNCLLVSPTHFVFCYRLMNQKKNLAKNDLKELKIEFYFICELQIN